MLQLSYNRKINFICLRPRWPLTNKKIHNFKIWSPTWTLDIFHSAHLKQTRPIQIRKKSFPSGKYSSGDRPVSFLFLVILQTKRSGTKLSSQLFLGLYSVVKPWLPVIRSQGNVIQRALFLFANGLMPHKCAHRYPAKMFIKAPIILLLKRKFSDYLKVQRIPLDRAKKMQRK